MTFSQGNLDHSDLSANAGILGTQIADKSLQLRNLSDDAFGIVLSGTATVTITSGDTGQTVVTTIPHNLGFAPASLAYLTVTPGDFDEQTGETLLPYTALYEFITGSSPSIEMRIMAHFFFTTDSTNAYAQVSVSDVSFFSQLQTTYTFKYYLLQETATQ